MIVWELLLGILGVGEYLRHVLGTGIAERQHALRFFRFEILEFRQPVVLVIVRAGDTGQSRKSERPAELFCSMANV